VSVPLDRSGAVPGTIRLHADVARAKSATDAPLLAIAGLPGQATTTTLDADSLMWKMATEFQSDDGRTGYAWPSRDVVVLDLRGTGKSGPLRCEALERATSDASVAAAECAAALGLRRGFYTARDSADDIEAVRKALGSEEIALLGISYGARVALTYAQRYPSRVDRLLLQSPPPPDGGDLFHRSAFAAIPEVVRARCGPLRCRRASRSPVADVQALARRLEQRPIGGVVVDGSGRRRTARLDAFDLFELLGGKGGPVATDEAAVPGFVRNALRGDVDPLLRAQRSERWYTFAVPSPDFSRLFSSATSMASTCEESVLPWARSTRLENRDAEAAAFVVGLPAGALDPFGARTALKSDLVELCRKWPVASAAPDPPRSLPPIPTLIMAGGQDLVAPPSQARAVGRLIPGARVLEIPGSDSELDLSFGTCASTAFRAFFADDAPPARCGRPMFGQWRARRAPPLSLTEVAPEPGSRGRVGRTVAAVRFTLRDGAETIAMKFFARVVTGTGNGRRFLLQLYGKPVRTGALRRGTYRLGFRQARFALRDASYVPGVRISGAIGPYDEDKPSRPHGHLRVSGPAAAHGKLTLRGHFLSGRLGGRPVRMRIGGDTYPDISFGR
jgi:pimeloyl-ACP methyl ester carboxylesterase